MNAVGKIHPVELGTQHFERISRLLHKPEVARDLGTAYGAPDGISDDDRGDTAPSEPLSGEDE